jgi:hypothetical protein
MEDQGDSFAWLKCAETKSLAHPIGEQYALKGD